MKRAPKVIDGLKIKLYNRRIKGFMFADGSFQFNFKRFIPETGETSLQQIHLSSEAFAVMSYMVGKLRSNHPDVQIK